MVYSPKEWARVWKAAAKGWRSIFRELREVQYDLIEEIESLQHAYMLEAWLKGFRQRVIRKKWRTSRVWQAWFLLKTREHRLERLQKLQAPQVLLTNELRMIKEANKALNVVIALERVADDPQAR